MKEAKQIFPDGRRDQGGALTSIPPVPLLRCQAVCKCRRQIFHQVLDGITCMVCTTEGVMLDRLGPGRQDTRLRYQFFKKLSGGGGVIRVGSAGGESLVNVHLC